MCFTSACRNYHQPPGLHMEYKEAIDWAKPLNSVCEVVDTLCTDNTNQITEAIQYLKVSEEI